MSSSTSVAAAAAAVLCGCALASVTQAIIDTGTQEFVFNPPRTYGLRMRVNF